MEDGTEGGSTLLARVEALAAQRPAADARRRDALEAARIEAALVRLEIRFGVRGRVENVNGREVYLLDDLVLEEGASVGRDGRCEHSVSVLGCVEHGRNQGISVRSLPVTSVEDLVEVRRTNPELALHADMVLPILTTSTQRGRVRLDEYGQVHYDYEDDDFDDLF